MDRKPFFSFCAAGPKLDVDDYVKKTTIEFDEIYQVGEPCSAMNPAPNKYNGIAKNLGNPENLDIDQQDQIAQAFIRNNYDDLKLLSNKFDVERKDIDLSPDLYIEQNVKMACLGFSQKLVELAGNLGISLSLNVATKIIDLNKDDNNQ